MFCSVIIPVYNGSKTIDCCLDALAQQTTPPNFYEIIVVDDGSTDTTAENVSAWCTAHPTINCHMLQQKNQGPAAARNYGAHCAKGELLLFTDADCRPLPPWIATFSAAFAADATLSAAMGSYISSQPEVAAQFAQLEFEERYAHMCQQATIDVVATYSAAFRRDIFLATSGFDAAFPKANNEDVEFSYRLSQLGHRMIFVPAAMVAHPHSASWWSYGKTKFSRAYWRTIVYKRYPAKAIKDSYTPQILKLQILLAPLCLMGLILALAGWPGIGIGLCAPFLLTTVPMSKFALRRNWTLVIWTPWGLWVRSVVFALGVAWAIVRGRS
ncbi:MAG: glycosyltransferase [Caldilineaceae bacterium]